MTFTLPTPVGSASGWQLTDYRQLSYTTGPAAGGTTTAYADQLDVDVMWLVDRAVVFSTSTNPSAVRLYNGSAGAGRLLSGSNSGNYDEADYPNGLLVPAGGQLLAVWTLADDGAVGTLNLQVRELRQVTS
jgi:hypothetical protein